MIWFTWNIDFILWGTEPPSLSSIWIQFRFVSNASGLHAACIKLPCPDSLWVWIGCLCGSLPPFLSCWAATWFKIYCTGPVCHWRQSQGEKGREGERKRKRREQTQWQRFPSPLPPLPLPSVSPTLSTQRILAADGGSTAPLQWDGGGGELSALCLQTRGPPRALRLSDGVWTEGLSDLWLDSLQVFVSTKHNSRLYSLPHVLF